MTLNNSYNHKEYQKKLLNGDGFVYYKFKKCIKCKNKISEENFKKYNGICWTCYMNKKVSKK